MVGPPCCCALKLVVSALPDPVFRPTLQPDGESNPLKFSQVFHLMPVGTSFVVTNGARPAKLTLDTRVAAPPVWGSRGMPAAGLH